MTWAPFEFIAFGPSRQIKIISSDISAAKDIENKLVITPDRRRLQVRILRMRSARLQARSGESDGHRASITALAQYAAGTRRSSCRHRHSRTIRCRHPTVIVQASPLSHNTLQASDGRRAGIATLAQYAAGIQRTRPL